MFYINFVNSDGNKLMHSWWKQFGRYKRRILKTHIISDRLSKIMHISDDGGGRARLSMKCQQISTTYAKINLCGITNLSTHLCTAVKVSTEKESWANWKMPNRPCLLNNPLHCATIRKGETAVDSLPTMKCYEVRHTTTNQLTGWWQRPLVWKLP